KSGRRTLVVGLRHDLVQRRREQMREAGFAKTMHPRNGVEGTHSELVRGHGLRRTKYRGLSRVSLSHYLMGAACNVKRYLNLLAFEMTTPALSHRLRAKSSLFSRVRIKVDENLSLATFVFESKAFFASIRNKKWGFFSRIKSLSSAPHHRTRSADIFGP